MSSTKAWIANLVELCRGLTSDLTQLHDSFDQLTDEQILEKFQGLKSDTSLISRSIARCSEPRSLIRQNEQSQESDTLPKQSTGEEEERKTSDEEPGTSAWDKSVDDTLAVLNARMKKAAESDDIYI